MICDRCGNPLEDSGGVWDGKPVPQNELYIRIGGGYGSFIDPISRGGDYEYKLCHDCGMLVAALFPAVMAEHHTSLVPCTCPEYLETKKRFDEEIDKQARDWPDHKTGHLSGETDCMYCGHPEAEDLGEIIHNADNGRQYEILGGENPWTPKS